jgi:hypothetical protein
MNAQPCHHQLLAEIRGELAKAGYPLSTSEQGEMALMLERINRINTREDAESLSLELDREIQQLDAGSPTCAIAPAWLKACECA